MRFVVEEGQVTLVTGLSLLLAVWANNHGGDAGDSVADVRRARERDALLTAAKWDRVAAVVETESRTEDEIESGLLEQLGLTR